MHRPVLAAETVRWLAADPAGTYVDGTVGGGGHAAALLARLGPRARLLAVDRDEAALSRARARLAQWGSRCTFVPGNFAELAEIATACGVTAVHGVLLDLGMSSMQLADGARGFSLMRDGPLDMRMDPSRAGTAADLVNTRSESELRRLLRTLGEEPAAARIARAIVRERAEAPIRSTCRLAEIVTRARGGRRGAIHPATRTFQALRMEVNEELPSLERGLAAALHLLVDGGRLGVIAFHSLEDRLAKQVFRRHAGRWENQPEGGRRWLYEPPEVRILTRKPVTPSAEEIRENPRARSARLRVAERKGN